MNAKDITEEFVKLVAKLHDLKRDLEEGCYPSPDNIQAELNEQRVSIANMIEEILQEVPSVKARGCLPILNNLNATLEP